MVIGVPEAGVGSVDAIIEGLGGILAKAPVDKRPFAVYMSTAYRNAHPVESPELFEACDVYSPYSTA